MEITKISLLYPWMLVCSTSLICLGCCGFGGRPYSFRRLCWPTGSSERGMCRLGGRSWVGSSRKGRSFCGQCFLRVNGVPPGILGWQEASWTLALVTMCGAGRQGVGQEGAKKLWHCFSRGSRYEVLREFLLVSVAIDTCR